MKRHYLQNQYNTKVKVLIFSVLYFIFTPYSYALLSQTILTSPLIRSNYKDSLNNQILNKVEGTGVILGVGEQSNSCKDCRYFILTASHVSQGDNFDATVGTEKLIPVSPNSRLADTRKDIELIEIYKPHTVQPLAWLKTLDNGIFRFTTEFRLINSELLQHVDSQLYITPFWVESPISTFNSTNFNIGAFLILPIKNFCDHQMAGPNVNSEPLPPVPLKESIYGDVQYAAQGTIIAPGMSGAPLFKKENSIKNNNSFILDGIALKFERFGIGSFFSNAESIMNLFNSYLNKENIEHRSVEPIYWKSRLGLLYREFCSNWNNCNHKNLEIAPDTIPAGGGTEGDGSGPITNNKCGRGDFINDFKLTSGIQYEGKNSIGFQITQKSNGDSFYIDANLAALDFIFQNKNKFEFQPVIQGRALIPILLNRYKINIEKSKLPLIINYSDYPDFSLNISDEKISIKTLSPRYNLENVELIEFSLDKFGRLLDENGNAKSVDFKSIIEVSGSTTGTIYYVDLRGLFFVNLYFIDKNDEDPISLIKDAFFRGGIIKVRPKNQLTSSRTIQFYLPKTFFQKLFDL